MEPSERVRIQALSPDRKEPYKVISRILFTDSDDFPNEVVFNPGLNAIIGSRSSGKSALLSYLAHAVDPEYTLRQQVTAIIDENEAGPGASVTWEDVKDIQYTVEWASPIATTGKVIYIPQNSLYAISERPDDITAKIQPAVFRNAPIFEADFRKTESELDDRNNSIGDAVSEWFTLDAEVRTLGEEIRGLGDRQAIIDRKMELEKQIRTLQVSSALTEEEIKLYNQVVGDIAKNNMRLQEIDEEAQNLSAYVQLGTEEGMFEATDLISVNIEICPSLALLPEALQTKLNTILDQTRKPLLDQLKACIADYMGTCLP